MRLTKIYRTQAEPFTEQKVKSYELTMMSKSAEEEVRLSMRVMINKDKTKVLFAVIDNNFADVLLSFLTLPLGEILRILKKQYGDDDHAPVVIGSLNTLHNGISNLDIAHFSAETGKLMLLNPRNSLDDECRKLRINIDDTQLIKYFTCEDPDCEWYKLSDTMYHATESTRCPCGKVANNDVVVNYHSNSEDENGEVFTVKRASFLVSDDLRLLPNGTGSIVQTLMNLGVTDVHGAEQRTITLGFKEIMDLFKGSLFSKTPLTDLILHQNQMHPHSSTAESEQFTLLTLTEKEDTSNSEKKIIVKVMLQKSTNKLLFAQSEEDFIDFLFSFLTIPLGEVESLLDSNSSLGSIDNLYKSLQNLNPEKYMKDYSSKEMLLKPKLAPKFLSKNQIFSLTEKDWHGLTYDKAKVDIKDPKGGGIFVKEGPGMFMITDDLTVTPLCTLSSLCMLIKMNISVSDVEELEVKIGLEEGLSILKASLTSTSALTKSLGPILMKQPKEEQY